tara:strand:- start:98 stop:424 length:327 start_codon:yes stop_codon:yes gene_type:complete
MSKYFKEIEENMNVDFLYKLDEARQCAKIPFIITSAYRSKEHNAKIGGVANSSHIKGLAVDIRVNSSRERFTILKALIYVGFNRIGVADNFIHVDDDKEKSNNVIWTY